MFQYRQVVVRLRQGDSDRHIARAGLMGSQQGAGLSGAGRGTGWLAAESQLPEEARSVWYGGQARASREALRAMAKRDREALVKLWSRFESDVNRDS